MKKAAIVTLYGNNNYGNKLQNYAVQEILKKNEVDVITIKNIPEFNVRDKYLLRIIYYYSRMMFKREGKTSLKTGSSVTRLENFLKFDRYINKTPKYFNYFNRKNFVFDYYFVGSDQVWNPGFGLNDFGMLDFVNDNSKKIAFSASIGVNQIPDSLKGKYKRYISEFKSISVREDNAKKVIEDLTNRKDVEVLVDPTMLLTVEEWNKVSNRPKYLDDIKNEKYILLYFLGKLSEEIKIEIEKVAKKNNCHIINILDKNDPFFTCGPSEFLYLEKNAFLVCTDSFHSSVFAFLFDRPFIVFRREQKNKNNDMFSRLETLLNTFKISDRMYNGRAILDENLKHDYVEAYKILEIERNKTKEFLKRVFTDEEEEENG